MRTLCIMVAMAGLGCADDRPATTAASAPARAPELPVDASPEIVAANREFCAEVLAGPAIAEILGAPFQGTRPGQPQSGVVDCQMLFAGGTREVSIAADCSEQHPKIEFMARVLGAQSGFRTIDIGSGGAFAHSKDGRVAHLHFEADAPSCAVYVSGIGVQPAELERVARYTLMRLPIRDVPR